MKVLEAKIADGSKAISDLSRDNVLMAITVGRNLEVQCYTDEQNLRKILEEQFAPNPLCCAGGDCCPCDYLIIRDGVSRAVLSCLIEIARGLYPETYEKLRQEGRSRHT